MIDAKSYLYIYIYVTCKYIYIYINSEMAISTVRILGKNGTFTWTLHKRILVANISHRKWWASRTMDSVRSTQMEMPNWLLAKKIDVQSWWFECSCSKSSLRWSLFSMEFGDHWNILKPNPAQQLDENIVKLPIGLNQRSTACWGITTATLLWDTLIVCAKDLNLLCRSESGSVWVVG